MGFKDSLGNKMKNLARLFPGIPEYQDKENLRAQDKVVREHLSEMLMRCVKQFDNIKMRLIESKNLGDISKLEKLTKQLQRMADTIKYDSYGYSPLYSTDPIDTERLDRLREYDSSLAREIGTLRELIEQIEHWKMQFSISKEFESFQERLDRVEELVKGRKKYA